MSTIDVNYNTLILSISRNYGNILPFNIVNTSNYYNNDRFNNNHYSDVQVVNKIKRLVDGGQLIFNILKQQELVRISDLDTNYYVPGNHNYHHLFQF